MSNTMKHAMRLTIALPVATLLGTLTVPGAPAAAQGVSAPVMQLAQTGQDPNKKPPAAAPHPAPRTVAPRPVQPRVNPPAHVNAPVRTGPRVVAPSGGPPRGPVVQSGPKPRGPIVGAPKSGAVINSGPKVITRSGSGKTVQTFTPRGPRSHTVTMQRLRGFPAQGVGRAAIRGHNYSVWRHERRFRYRGGWRTFIALGALGAIAIGAAEYYPYAYIDAPVDYCDGLTEDGCQLVWQDVETIEGDIVPQCVAYCPWQ